MNFPWRKAEADPAETTDDTELVGEGWEEEAAEGEEEPEEEDEPSLDGMSPEAAQQAQKYAAAQVARERLEREKILAGAQELGMTFDQDGHFGVTDMNRLATRLGADPGQQQSGVPVGPAPVAEPVPDPRPSMYEDPDGYANWIERDMDRRVTAAVAAVAAENERLKALMYDQGARTAAGSVEDAVRQYSPILAPALDHPDFKGLYEKALEGQAPEHLRDPRFLTKVAGWVAAELDPARMPAPVQPGERRLHENPVYQANRAGLPAAGGRGSMPVARQETAPRLSQEEASIMRAFEQVAGPISREQMQALAHTNIGDYDTAYAQLMRGKKGAGK